MSPTKTRRTLHRGRAAAPSTEPPDEPGDQAHASSGRRIEEVSLRTRSTSMTEPLTQNSEDTVMEDQSFPAQDSGYLTSRDDASTNSAGKSRTTTLATNPSADKWTGNAANADGLINSFSRGLKNLMAIINKLKALGIDDNFNIPLPKIVVLGDQSAGKSSQIEALSEIKVPRASGLCTRCVLHISLTTSKHANSPWRCNVSLLKKFDHFGAEAVIDAFGPWHRKIKPESVAFLSLSDKNQLERAMQCAQIALLNPSKPHTMFLKTFHLNNNEAQFSPNEVHLEIESPSLPNLTFYDIPGIISEDGNQRSELPALVRAVAKEYMKQDNTIIMLARAMTSDPATSSAGSLVTEMGAADRTVGVLTKPDRLEQGANVQQWDEILRGRTFRAGHGYFVTKQPTQADLDRNINHAQARANEVEFFQTQEPWCTSLKQHADKFGTAKLSKHLSRLLETEISHALPEIKQSINDKLAEIEAQLEALPKAPPEGCLGIVMGFLQVVSTTLEQHMAGELPHNGFINLWRDYTKELRKILVSSKPTVVVKTGVEPKWRMRAETIDVDSPNEDNGSPDVPIRAGTQKRPMGPPTSPSKRQRSVQRSGVNGEQPSATPETSVHDHDTDHCSSDMFQPKRFELSELNHTLHRMNTSGLPNQVDPRAEAYLIGESQQHWHAVVKEYMRKVEDHLKTHMSRLLNKPLEKWSETLLDSETRRVTALFLDDILAQFRVFASRSVEAELLKPMTQNEELYEKYREQELVAIKHARFIRRAEAFINHGEEKLGDAVTEPGSQQRKKKLERVTMTQLGEDPFAVEIEVMARVRAYYLIAADYMADNLAKATNFELFNRCRRELVSELQKALRMESDDAVAYAKQLLAEDAEREAQRARLHKEREQLLAAKKLFENSTWK